MCVAHVPADNRSLATNIASFSHNALLQIFDRLDRQRVILLSGKTVIIASRAGRFKSTMKFVLWGVAFLIVAAIIAFMNNPLVQGMIYPVPSYPVPEQPPSGYEQPGWDLEIHGWLHRPSRANAKQVMLYFHGNGENLGTIQQSGLLEELQSLDIPFLIVDYPGYGLSRGKPSEQSISRTGIAAAEWVKSAFPEHDLILCGWSLGASVAVQTASGFKQTDALIALSAWTSLNDVAKLHFSDWLVGILLKERFDAFKAAQNIRVPALFIHGEQDDLIPANQGHKVANAASARWVLLPSAGHNDLMAHREVWNEIDRFLKEMEKKTKSGL